MLKKSFRQLHNDSGSTLIMVLLVFTVLMLLGMAALTASTVSTNITASTAAKQQADFIAQSAAKSAVSYIEKNNIQLSSGTLGGSVNFTDKGVASNIQVKFINSSAISVTAKYTNNKGVTGTAVAYLTKSASTAPLYPPDASDPFNFMFYSTGTFNYNDNQNIYGSIFANSNISLSGMSKIDGSIMSNSDVSFNSSGITVSGDIFGGANVNFNGSVSVGGKVIYASNINGQSNVSNAKSITKTANSSAQIKAVTSMNSVNPSNFTSDQKTKYSYISDCANPLTISGTGGTGTVTTSGRINSTNWSTLTSYSTIIVDTDTSGKDIWMIFDYADQNNAWKKPNIQLKGSHNLYILINTSNKFTISSATNIDMYDQTASVSNVYIFGASGSSIFTNSQSNININACIYIPNGVVNFQSCGNSVINGDIITGELDGGASMKLNYLPPNITGTPLENIIPSVTGATVSYGSGSGSGSTWSLSGWSSQ